MLAGSLFGAVLTLGTSYLTGRLLWRNGEAPLQFALGAAIVAHLVFLLGWCRALRPEAFLALAFVLCAASLWRARLPSVDIQPRWWWALVAPFAVFLFIHACGPDTQPDEVAYHLGLVREWLRLGRFPTRVGFYESMPQQAELLFTFAYAFGGATAAKLVHLGFFAALIALIARMAGRFAPPLLIAASPVVMIDGASAYNDVMLAFNALCIYRALQLQSTARAGLLAGAAYAVKMTGGVFAAGAFAWVLLRNKGWLRFAAAALVFPAPWIVRNIILAQNPFAPLFNAWFPNEHFHISTEALLRENLSTYQVHGIDRLLHLLFGGGILGGHIGAGFVFAPLALWWAFKNRETRGYLAAALVAAVPWLANAGTRFLIPALPFVALALPPQLAWPAAVLQVATLAWNAPPGSWQLHGWTAQAEPSEPGVVAILAKHTRAGERILDFVAAPMSRIDATPYTPWGQVSADRAAAALRLAHDSAPGLLYNLRADWHPVRLHSLSLTLEAPAPSSLRIQEMNFGQPADCTLTATRHTSETPFAFDRTPVTGWSSWAPARAGEGITVTCPHEVETSGLRATVAYVWPGMKLRVEGDGHLLNADPGFTPVAPLNWRRAATGAVRREGFRWILIRDSQAGYGQVGGDILARPGDWGLQPIANSGNVYLFRVP
ncbi:MAG: hypothetical protein ABI972_27050 [Acidobacteriota bacterium]